jgi:hypothetical protein
MNNDTLSRVLYLVKQTAVKYSWAVGFPSRPQYKVCTVSHVYDRYILNCEPGSSGSVVSDYRLDDRETGVRSPAEAKGFFL